MSEASLPSRRPYYLMRRRLRGKVGLSVHQRNGRHGGVWPAFSDVEVVIAEEAFALNAFLFPFDFILFGVRVVPGLGHKSFGFILGWHGQLYCAASEGVFLTESVHYCWHVALVFTT